MIVTTRKPPSAPFPDWVERQIRTAEAEGAFDNLPGHGKPIPDIDRTPHELAWVANYLRRENVQVAGLLPPGLALAKEVEDLQLLPERCEERVRALVADLNARIDHAHAQPQVGPPLRVKRVDVEAAVDEWRQARAALERARAERPVAEPIRGAATTRRRRRFLRRRSLERRRATG